MGSGPDRTRNKPRRGKGSPSGGQWVEENRAAKRASPAPVHSVNLRQDTSSGSAFTGTYVWLRDNDSWGVRISSPSGLTIGDVVDVDVTRKKDGRTSRKRVEVRRVFDDAALGRIIERSAEEVPPVTAEPPSTAIAGEQPNAQVGASGYWTGTYAWLRMDETWGVRVDPPVLMLVEGDVIDVKVTRKKDGRVNLERVELVWVSDGDEAALGRIADGSIRSLYVRSGHQPPYGRPDEETTGDRSEAVRESSGDEKPQESRTGLVCPDLVRESVRNTEFGLDLYDFQLEGAAHAVHNRRVLIADEPGLGKTRQALLALAADPGSRPALICAPPSLLTHWAREAKAAMPDADVRVVQAGKNINDAAGADITVVPYSLMSTGKRFLEICELLPERLGSVVFDELHNCKSHNSKRTQAAQILADRVDPDGMRIGLTGTPIPNKVRDLVAPLEIIGRMDDMVESKWDFLKRYCGPRKIWTGRKEVTVYDGATRVAELSDKLHRGTMVRRRKADVLTALPDKTVNMSVHDLHHKIQRPYEKLHQEVKTWVALAESKKKSARQEDSEASDESNPTDDYDNASLRDDDSLFDHEAWIDGDIGPVVELCKHAIDRIKEIGVTSAESHAALYGMGKLREVVGYAKAPDAVLNVREILEGTDEKVLVFGWHRHVNEFLSHHLEAPLIYGGTRIEERQRIMDEFNSDPDERVLVLSISAASEGLNLQAASRVVFAEQPWNPAQARQAEDRAHRIGQSLPVTVEHMIAAGTIDEHVAALNAWKANTSSNVLDSGQGDEATKFYDSVREWMELEGDEAKPVDMDDLIQS